MNKLEAKRARRAAEELAKTTKEVFTTVCMYSKGKDGVISKVFPSPDDVPSKGWYDSPDKCK